MMYSTEFNMNYLEYGISACEKRVEEKVFPFDFHTNMFLILQSVNYGSGYAVGVMLFL